MGSKQQSKRANLSARTQQMHDDDQYYAVGILDSRTRHGHQEYLVLWEGFPPEEASWEPRANISDALYRQFRNERVGKAKTRRLDLELNEIDAGEDQTWNGWKVPTDEDEAQLQQRQKANGFEPEDPERKLREQRKHNAQGRRSRAQGPTPAPLPASSTQRTVPQEEEEQSDIDQVMTDAPLQVSPPATPAAQAQLTQHAAEASNDDGDDETCNDPYANELGVTSHSTEITHCSDPRHQDRRTCTDCFNATLATMSQAEQNIYATGGFLSLCRDCGQYDLRRNRACQCLDKEDCCACLVELVARLLQAKQEGDAENEDGECQVCITMLDGTEKVERCALCMGNRVL